MRSGRCWPTRRRSPAGATLAEALAPSTDQRRGGAGARRRRPRRCCCIDGGAPRLAGAHDVRPAATAAAARPSCSPTSWPPSPTPCAPASMPGACSPPGTTCPALTAIADAVAPSLEGLAAAIEAAVEPDGAGVRDGASPQLRSLRREIAQARGARRRPAARAGRAQPAAAPAGGLHHRARRAARCSPSRPSAARAVPGIVHDTLGLGADAVRRAVRDRRGAATDARAGGGGARGGGAHPGRAVRAGGRRGARRDRAPSTRSRTLDLALAGGALSRALGGCPVEPPTTSGCSRRAIRCSTRPTAVPIDLDLRGHPRAWSCRGPNTGGKTVALKTLGLAALMHQCGLRPPARTARLPVFDAVLADIGDEQSIAMSLSTFSGHMRNLVAILDAARRALAGAARRGRGGHRPATRARRSRRRCSSGSSSAARWCWRRPTTPS